MSLLFMMLLLMMLPVPLLATITVMERRRAPVRESRTNRGVRFR
jgi:hypothetical protein